MLPAVFNRCNVLAMTSGCVCYYQPREDRFGAGLEMPRTPGLFGN